MCDECDNVENNTVRCYFYVYFCLSRRFSVTNRSKHSSLFFLIETKTKCDMSYVSFVVLCVR